MGRSGPLILGGFLLFAGFATPALLSSYDLGLLSLALMYGMAAMAQTFLTGTANQASLGNSAFLLIGAYGSASLSSDGHLPFLLAALLSILIATFVGIVGRAPDIEDQRRIFGGCDNSASVVVQEILTGWDSVGGSKRRRCGAAVVDGQRPWLAVLIIDSRCPVYHRARAHTGIAHRSCAVSYARERYGCSLDGSEPSLLPNAGVRRERSYHCRRRNTDSAV